MKKNLEKTILEMFGEPIIDNPRSSGELNYYQNSDKNDELGEICPNCEMMSVNGNCGCSHQEDESGGICPGCGMTVINGQCGCEHVEVCPMCGQMPPTIDSSFSCGVTEGDEACSQCGMNETHCECDM